MKDMGEVGIYFYLVKRTDKTICAGRNKTLLCMEISEGTRVLCRVRSDDFGCASK